MGVAYLSLIPIVVFINGRYAVVHIAILVALSIFVFKANTYIAFLINIIWLLWVLIFNSTAICSYNMTKGKVNIVANKFILLGIYIPYTISLLAVSLIITL
jgi:hypothetical protein